MMDDDYDSGDDIVATKDGPAVASQLSRRKRKRAKREEAAQSTTAEAATAPATKAPTEKDAAANPAKKQKTDNRNGKSTAKPIPSGAKGKGKEDKSSIDPSIAAMDGKIMADYVGQRIQRFNKELSFVELGDRMPPESLYVDTSAHSSTRSLANLPAFMETFCTKKGQSSISHLKSSPKLEGAPHTLFICPAALRAADVVRVLRKYQTPDSAVAKFFAKHVKLAEAVEYSKTTRIGIAVGTPARILDLVKEGALQTRYLVRVVVDASYMDAKQRGIWDIKEVQEKVVELLALDGMRKRLGGGGDEDVRGVLFY